MRKFFQTPEFKKLNEDWRRKLAKSGFEDQEDSKENLQEYDRRTIAFDNAEKIEQFFRKLDAYLSDNPNLPRAHRKILQLYSNGEKAIHIGKKLRVTDRWVRKVVSAYKKKILSTQL